jgi:hypothetical protein
MSFSSRWNILFSFHTEWKRGQGNDDMALNGGSGPGGFRFIVGQKGGLLSRSVPAFSSKGLTSHGLTGWKRRPMLFVAV